MSVESQFDQLIRAVVADDVERLIALLDAGADVNARNEASETAFSYACAYNALAAAQVLFARGADINTVDAGGGTPLDWAVCQSSPEFREWLIGVGAKRRDESYEPWHWSPESERTGCNADSRDETN